MLWIAIVAAASSCGYLVLATDMSRVWKGLAVAITLGSLVALFHPAVAERVPFLVPMLSMVFVGLWGGFRMKLDGI